MKMQIFNGETEKPSDGSHHQNGTFENGSYVDGGGSLIEKPSQADKYEDENGFGGKPIVILFSFFTIFLNFPLNVLLKYF